MFFNLDMPKKLRGSSSTSTDQVAVKSFKRYWKPLFGVVWSSCWGDRNLIWTAVNSSTAPRQAPLYTLSSIPSFSRHKLHKLHWDVHLWQLRKLFTGTYMQINSFKVCNFLRKYWNKVFFSEFGKCCSFQFLSRTGRYPLEQVWIKETHFVKVKSVLWSPRLPLVLLHTALLWRLKTPQQIVALGSHSYGSGITFLCECTHVCEEAGDEIRHILGLIQPVFRLLNLNWNLQYPVCLWNLRINRNVEKGLYSSRVKNGINKSTELLLHVGSTKGKSLYLWLPWFQGNVCFCSSEDITDHKILV